MNKLKVRRYLIPVLVALLAALSYGYYNTRSQLLEQRAEMALLGKHPAKTDTIYVNRMYRDTIRIVQKARPKTVYVYAQPDTARRRRLEQDTLIGGIRLDSKMLEVELLTPKGVTVVESYPLSSTLPEVVSVASDGKVALQVDQNQIRSARQRRRLQSSQLTAGAVICFIAGVLVSK